jgi:hypothetical protein
VQNDVITAGGGQWQEQMLACAREPQSEFTALRPTETGLPMTIYASERDDYIALIVDSCPGMHYSPSPGLKAHLIGERTGNAEVDRWVSLNAKVLREYARQKIGTPTFYKRMRRGP